MTVDNCGRQVTFDKRPQRVLALHPEAAMMVALAGAGDRISAYAGFLIDVPGWSSPTPSCAAVLP